MVPAMKQTLRTPRWLALTAVSLVAIAAFAAMGVWQWARADIREEVAAANPLEGPAVPIEGVLEAGGLVETGSAPRPVTAAGSYDPAAQLVVPGRGVAGAPRDVVVTVLRLDRGDGVLVARGSIPPGQPAPPPPAGPVVVEGWLLAGEPLADGGRDRDQPGAAARRRRVRAGRRLRRADRAAAADHGGRPGPVARPGAGDRAAVELAQPALRGAVVVLRRGRRRHVGAGAARSTCAGTARTPRPRRAARPQA